jgi:hypothetical protein
VLIKISLLKELMRKKYTYRQKEKCPLIVIITSMLKEKIVNPLIVEYEGETYEDYPDKDYKILNMQIELILCNRIKNLTRTITV